MDRPAPQPPAVSGATAAPARVAKLDARLERLHDAAPELDRKVLELALSASDCARRAGLAPDARYLAVIDYSLPSTSERFWLFDLEREVALANELVAHGANTGDNRATRFSNRDGSRQTSLGLFRTAETYQGSNGYSMRLDGLEQGVNDRARDRAIVMHGAWYVSKEHATRSGRIGRSWGCPALDLAVSRKVIDRIQGGHLLFSYYPDQAWLASSRFLQCGRDAWADAGGSAPPPSAAPIRAAGR